MVAKKQQKKQKAKWIPLFDGRLEYVAFKSADKANKFLAKCGMSPCIDVKENYLGHVWQFAAKDGRERAVICIPGWTTKGKTAAKQLETLCHEAAHVKQFLMESLCESKPSTEFEAYITDSVFGGAYAMLQGEK